MDRTILYRDREGNITVRHITVIEENYHHIHAFCHLRGETRTFSKARIVRANVAEGEDVGALLERYQPKPDKRGRREVALVGMSAREKAVAAKAIRAARARPVNRFGPDVVAVCVGPRGRKSMTARAAEQRRIPILSPGQLVDFLDHGVVPDDAVAPLPYEEMVLPARAVKEIRNLRLQTNRTLKESLKLGGKRRQLTGEFLPGLDAERKREAPPAEPAVVSRDPVAALLEADAELRRTTQRWVWSAVAIAAVVASVFAEALWLAIAGGGLLVVVQVVTRMGSPK